MMIQSIYTILLCLLTVSLSKAQTYEEEVHAYRMSLVKSMVDYTDNPPVQWSDTLYMDYFPLDSSWILQAEFEPLEKDSFIQMPTTAGTEKVFKVLGRASFTVRDTMAELTIFQPLRGSLLPYYFIPFKDGSSGLSTYGGGRYLEGPVPSEDARTIRLDFNKAYNPWCAFNDGYYCPLPPASNSIAPGIQAGEKNFRKDGEH